MEEHQQQQKSGAETSAGLITTATTTATSRDLYLKHLNKISHKISKPVRRTASFDRSQIESLDRSLAEQGPPVNEPPAPPPHQHQPPVYNINKSDFRDVVQRLTGAPPSHERLANPPPIQPPKPQSSRLQRIRPPPLAPPPLTGFLPGQRQPLSPLPPFPSVHAAAESPISAYMRFLQTPPEFAGGVPPLQSFPPPLPFGCVPSPRSPYGMMFPPPQGMMFPPSQGMMFPPSQLPLSPTPPVPSPRRRGT